MPPGIRQLTNSDGSIRYEARVNRQGISMSRGYPSVKEARDWKSRMDALISSGIDPRELDASKGKVKRPKATAQPALTSSIGVRDEPRQARPNLTVAEAIDGYIAARGSSPNKLRSNQISELEQVKSDLGNLKIAYLDNGDLVSYINLLLDSYRKRDDPVALAEMNRKRELKRLERLKAEGKLPVAQPTANALAKARNRAKKKEERPRTEPQKLKEATVRRYIQALITAIKWAAKRYKIEYDRELFVFARKEMPAAWNGQRERRLFEGEEERLYAAGIDRKGYTYTQEDWKALIGFALETAMREQEIAFANLTDTRADGYKLYIPRQNSKTGKPRTALLSKKAREIIEIQRATSPPGNKRIFHQFPSPRAICDAFAALTKRAGISDLTFHDLRHEATSRLCESGKLIQMEIMEMTGHDTLKTFKGYVKILAHENQRRLD